MKLERESRSVGTLERKVRFDAAADPRTPIWGSGASDRDVGALSRSSHGAEQRATQIAPDREAVTEMRGSTTGSDTEPNPTRLGIRTVKC